MSFGQARSRDDMTVASNCVQFPPQPCYIGHMRSRLRSLFLCLLIVSLPVQGIAGVARSACGMAHHPSTVDDVEPDIVLTVAMAGTAMQDNGHEHVDAAAQGSSSSDGDCESDSLVGHEPSSCDTCAGCGIGASAPPPVLLVNAMEEPANGLKQLSPSSFTGHIPARIERPPRHFAPYAA